MKHFEYPNLSGEEPSSLARSPYSRSNLVYLLAFVKRNLGLLGIAFLIGILGGLTYYATLTPMYTATTYAYAGDFGKQSDNKSADPNAPPVDTTEIDSKAEVISSREVAEAMSESLSPDDRNSLAKAFGARSGFSFAQWASRIGTLHFLSPAKPLETASSPGDIDFKRVLKALSVKRMERTYILGISFSAPNPALAATVANAFVDAYQNVMDARKFASRQKRNDWLTRHIEDVRTSLLQAEKDLQNFHLAPIVGDSDVAKRELELKTQNYRSLYQLLLQQQATPDDSTLQNGLYVMTRADPSGAQRSPPLFLVATLSLVAGLGSGVLAAAIREASDQTFRTRGQVEDGLGARFLGWLPEIRRTQRKAPRTGPASRDPADPLPDVLRYSTSTPQSCYAETLREIATRACLALENEATVVGIVAALPGEGKSTLSVNLGRLLAREGRRSLVIDGDLRNRGLSESLAPSAQRGLLDLLSDVDNRICLEDVLVVDQPSGAFVLPVARSGEELRNSGNRPSQKFRTLLRDAKKTFDIIIVDLPPFAAVAEGRLLSTHCDCFVLVTEWGRTNRGVVWRFLESEKAIRERLLGVVLNKVNLRKLRKYEQDNEPQHGPYRRYFIDNA